MKKVATAACLLALLAPGCIVVDDEPPPPCEVGECADASADSSPQDSTADSTVDSATTDTASPDSTIDSAIEDASDSAFDSAIDTLPDLGGDTGVPDSGNPDTRPVDTGADTGAPDTGPLDTGPLDTGSLDTGSADTFVVDAAEDTLPDVSAEDAADAADSSTMDAVGETSDAAPTSCPSGRGSAMVRVSGSGDGGSYTFCVDKYETTNADYLAFLDSSPATTGQPTDCTMNSSFTPTGTWPAAAGDVNKPVVNVDWCDATAYCKWAGKRLCGKIGGGPFNVAVAAESRDPLISEWQNVCTGADVARAFPYGPTYSATACRANATSTSEVGSLATCEGGYPGVYDMSGNVYEWLNSCAAGAANNCLIAGGGFNSTTEGSLRCDVRATKARNAVATNTGIRCCAD